MQNVYIVGIGATPIGEHYTQTFGDLARTALKNALADTGNTIDPSALGALYVANAYGSSLTGQSQMGAAVASAVGLAGIEAVSVDSVGASGGMTLRQAAMAIASGMQQLIAVVGVEKVSDKLDDEQEMAQAAASDVDFEAEHGVTLTAQWAMLMRRYMHEYKYDLSAFAPFPVNAHANAVANSQALYRFPITAEKVIRAAPIADPIGMLDSATLMDGAAVVLLASEGMMKELGRQGIRLAGSAVATDTLALFARRDPLWLGAAQRSTAQALRMAGLKNDDLNVLEFTDPHSIAAALALEASGFAERGTAPRLAADGSITTAGKTPIATGGGYKARGDAGGASGVYQTIEAVRQLRGEAGKAQVANAQAALVQCMGGVGATVVTHILTNG